MIKYIGGNAFKVSITREEPYLKYNVRVLQKDGDAYTFLADISTDSTSEIDILKALHEKLKD